MSSKTAISAISVTLISTAKIGNEISREGSVLDVTLTEAKHLEAAGAIAPLDWDAIASAAPGTQGDALDRAKAAEARVAELEAGLAAADDEILKLKVDLFVRQAELIERNAELQAVRSGTSPEAASSAEDVQVQGEPAGQAGEDAGAKSPAGKKVATKAAKG